jgi:hypothetical protein
MKVGFTLFFAVQIGLSVGFYPELFCDGPFDSLVEYGNLNEYFPKEPRHGCRQPMGEAEAGGMKLIARLKRMTECRGGVQSV